MAKFRTHYDNLKVARDSPDAVVRAAYKTLMQQYHPDKYQGPEEEALRIVKLIKQSYEILIDPVKRKEHNQWIAAEEYRLQNEATQQSRSNTQTEYSQAKTFYTSEYSENDLYELIAEEIDSGNTKKGLMTKAYAEVGGDKDKTTARYIQLRLEELRGEQDQFNKIKKQQTHSEKHYVTELARMGYKVNVIKQGSESKWLLIHKHGKKIEIKHFNELVNFYAKQKKNNNTLKLPNLSSKRVKVLLFIMVIIVTTGLNLLLYAH